MMRRLFGRTPAPGSSPLEVRADGPVHGCPACPHAAPIAQRDLDDDGASTLLPLHQTDLDGGSFELSVTAADDSIDFDAEPIHLDVD